MKGIIVTFLAILCVSLGESEVPVCPPPGPDGNAVNIPNPEDCSSFYTCVGTIPILSQCDADLWFNPILGVCDYPNNVPQGSCTPPPPKTTTTSNPTTLVTDTTTAGKSTTQEQTTGRPSTEQPTTEEATTYYPETTTMF